MLHGGPEGVRDVGLLESALARPKNLFAYSEQNVSIARLAASYAQGIVANHPFVDGNKRTAFTVSLTFLKLNGVEVTATREDRVLTFWSLGQGRFQRIVSRSGSSAIRPSADLPFKRVSPLKRSIWRPAAKGCRLLRRQRRCVASAKSLGRSVKKARHFLRLPLLRLLWQPHR